jgi:hypothetical protein
VRQAQPASLPTRAVLKPSGLFVALREIAPDELQDAFMYETVTRLAGPDEIVEIPDQELGRLAPGSAPTGLIFHVARCGSTLVSQVLKQQRNLVVYAEPLPFNEILVPPHGQGRARMVAALRSLAALFALHAGRPFVIKLSSWNTLFCDLVAEAFPATPWVLCVRDPLEVAVSLQSQRPGWLLDSSDPANLFADIVDPARESRTFETYLARLFAAFCSAAARLDPLHGSLVAYDGLPGSVWEVVAPRFGLDLDPSTRQRMARAARLDAKSPAAKRVEFTPDNDRKRAAASAALREAVDAVARPAFERLRRHFS